MEKRWTDSGKPIPYPSGQVPPQKRTIHLDPIAELLKARAVVGLPPLGHRRQRAL